MTPEPLAPGPLPLDPRLGAFRDGAWSNRGPEGLANEFPLADEPLPVDDEAPTGSPGIGPIILAGLAIGILLMGTQLWMLTVALELYLAGEGGRIWQIAIISGGIFVGGLLMLWLLAHRPRGHDAPPIADWSPDASVMEGKPDGR
jgi:hypothetical protein